MYESHDNMSTYIGMNGRRFFDIYGDLVDGIQRKMIEYIKYLQPTSTIDPSISRPDLLITTKDGYPWLPEPSDGIEQKKGELENLIRTYLNNHYS